jgi:two-component system CheB/CheR fusion protein
MPGEKDLGGVGEPYRLLMESATDFAVFFLDPQGRVATWDAGCERLFGYSGAEVMGQPDDLIFTGEDRAQGLPGQELSAAALGRAGGDRWHVRKDGTRVWVRATVTALRDEGGGLRGYAKVCRDLTEQRRAEEAVRDGERRYRALVENSWDGVTLVGADGTVLETTPITFRGLGYSEEEYVGRNAFAFLHPEDAPAVGALLGQLLQQPGGKLTAQYRLRRKDGSWVWVESVGTNLLGEPSVRAVVVNHRDVTEQRQAAEVLREADRRKDEFLALLGHELRNPLAPIRHAVQVLRQRQGEDAALRRAGDVIDRQVRHLALLVDDLLDVSRVRQGKVTLHKGEVELAAVVAHAVETWGPLIEARRQRFDLSLPPDPVRLEADPTRLAQVVANLLHNASKYTPEGGHIRLRAGREGSEVVLRLRDEGIGILPEMLPRIFDLFSQADRALDHAQGGLGIGLTLVKSLVEMHGGTVAAFSAGPGQGSEFTVRLPALPEAPPPSPPGPPRRHRGP